MPANRCPALRPGTPRSAAGGCDIGRFLQAVGWGGCGLRRGRVRRRLRRGRLACSRETHRVGRAFRARGVAFRRFEKLRRLPDLQARIRRRNVVVGEGRPRAGDVQANPQQKAAAKPVRARRGAGESMMGDVHGSVLRSNAAERDVGPVGVHAGLQPFVAAEHVVDVPEAGFFQQCRGLAGKLAVVADHQNVVVGR